MTGITALEEPDNDTTANAGEQLPPLVFMRFRPAWSYIDGIREFTEFFCRTTFNDTNLAERARMIIQETLENAVKYSSPGPRSELELVINASEESMEISVASKPDPQHLGALRQQVEELYERDPESAYLAAFRRAASNPEASARLGLARIRYEGNVELELDCNDDGRIRITAKGKI